MKAIDRRAGIKFKQEAALHGFEVSLPSSNAMPGDEATTLTPEQKAAMDRHLENAKRRKMMEKQRGLHD